MRVEVVSLSTKAARVTATDRSGADVLPNLGAASYEIRFALQGFKTSIARAQVTVGAAVTLDTTLELGELAETVSVVAAPERINTRTPEVVTAIHQRQLATLPTLTRNPYDFIALAGNVSLDDQVPAMRGAQGFAINGQRATSVNVLLDGAGNNDEFAASIGLPVPLDAVQEYGIISANFSAQFGRATGGIVNVITKAGSNEFHGSGDYFYRNESMSTRTVDEQSRGLLEESLQPTPARVQRRRSDPEEPRAVLCGRRVHPRPEREDRHRLGSEFRISCAVRRRLAGVLRGVSSRGHAEWGRPHQR